MTDSIPPSISFGFAVEKKGATKPLVLQRHTAIAVEVADATDLGRLQASPPIADAVWTNHAGIELFCFTADCVPVLLYGTDENAAVAAVHAGWRGTSAGIVKQTINAMQPSLSLDTSMGAIIGPCIRGCCYEVQDDFIEQFAVNGHDISSTITIRDGKKFFDLPDFLVKTYLAEIPEKQISLAHARCTYCTEPALPSYRRNGNTDPHIRSWIKRS